MRVAKLGPEPLSQLVALWRQLVAERVVVGDEPIHVAGHRPRQLSSVPL